eukprot:comp12229_c0_seq1/m.7007 comp12229_c0_seq1/g.7007  ORF comp12229_c0_seq1/g.7007 comp12229_c0_seq1/m.7007 type:complete len:556 (-) comp12229_c0_seq1:713-2380(-)
MPNAMLDYVLGKQGPEEAMEPAGGPVKGGGFLSRATGNKGMSALGPKDVREFWRQKMRHFMWQSMGRDVLSSSMTIVFTGAVMGLVQNAWNYVTQQIWRRFTVTAEFDSRDEAYQWLMEWLAEQQYAQNSTDVVVSAVEGTENVGEWVVKKVEYIPAPGIHTFTYKGRRVWLSRSDQSAADQRKPLTSITMTMFGCSRAALEQLMDEARLLSAKKDRGKTCIYIGDMYGSWQKCASRPKRPLHSVVLARGLAETLYKDALDFLQNEDWYRDRGIPYRRGYLLYGPPGNGKSSFITALGGALNIHIYVINIAAPALTDELLAELMSSTPERCLLLLEDLEYAFATPTEASNGPEEGECSNKVSTDVKSSKVTFSGLLNAIDGVAAQEGRILVLTTNNIHKLSATLIRPGRVDVRTYLGQATRSMLHRMFLNFFKDHVGAEELAPEFVHRAFNSILEKQRECMAQGKTRCMLGCCYLVAADAPIEPPWYGETNIVPEYGENQYAGKPGSDCIAGRVSMAQVQGYLMKHKSSPEDAVRYAHELGLQGTAPPGPRDLQA